MTDAWAAAGWAEWTWRASEALGFAHLCAVVAASKHTLEFDLECIHDLNRSVLVTLVKVLLIPPQSVSPTVPLNNAAPRPSICAITGSAIAPTKVIYISFGGPEL
jgi:hypothetical protein